MNPNVVVQCFQFSLLAGAMAHVRFCPWNDTQTHAGPGARFRLWVESRCYGIATIRTSIFECYQTRDTDRESPTFGQRLTFAPDGPMRHLQRDHAHADAYNLCDSTTPIDPTAFGGELWFEVGQVDETESPAPKKPMAFEFPQDTVPPPDQGDMEYVIRVHNIEGAASLVTLEVYAEIIEADPRVEEMRGPIDITTLKAKLAKANTERLAKRNIPTT